MARKTLSLEEFSRKFYGEEKCRNCMFAFGRDFEPTENFPEPSSIWACKLHYRMTNPESACSHFKLK